MNTLEFGIDEAGRGPVIGPMTIAGCVLDEKSKRELKDLKVKDSKQLTKKRREFLEKEIKKRAKYIKIIKIFPKEIDGEGETRIKLNELESIASSKIINEFKERDKKIKLFIDCPSVSIKKWEDSLKIKINDFSNLEISCEHNADKNHISVSAASILAKCCREREMDKLKQEYGESIGSGYCSDTTTIKFLKKNGKRYEEKGIFRKSWITWKKIYEK